jgi:DNA (cytosine-5)-methyltransferase 1
MVKLLDLYACQGGAGVGYERAGFDVYALDIEVKHAKRNPHPFHNGSALDALDTLLAGDSIAFNGKDGTITSLHLDDFDAIHASPPCQGYSIATAGNPTARRKHQRLIAATRDLLEATGLPWVIENVEQARAQMVDPMMLCGRMFGLETADEDGELLVLDRHRLFESNVPLQAPEHPRHGSQQVGGVYGGSRRAKSVDGSTPTPAQDRHAARYERGGGYVPRSREVQQRLLGIDWMDQYGMYQSLPPVYCEWIGSQLLNAAAAIRPDQAPEVAA